MMIRDWLIVSIEMCIWYAFVYTILYTIKHDVNLYVSTLVILVLLYIVRVAFPVFALLQVWQDLWKE